LAGAHPGICFAVFGVAALTPVAYSLVLYKKLEREGRLGAEAEQNVPGTAPH
jgi:hypothetical protein